MASVHQEAYGQSAEKHIVDADPSSSGVAAPIGSIANLDTGLGEWLKTGVGDTDWSRTDTIELLAGVIPRNTIDLSTNPTVTDTLDIGADVYEFQAAAADLAADANIAIERKGSAADTFTEVLAAINATAAAAHPTIFQTDSSTPALGRGTENVLAIDGGSQVLVIVPAAAPGGSAVPSSPNIAIAESLSAAVDWASANLNLLGGLASAVRQSVSFDLTITAAHVAAGTVNFGLPFTPRTWVWQAVTAADIHRLTQNDTVTASGDVLTLTLAGGAGPDIQATDVVHITVSE